MANLICKIVRGDGLADHLAGALLHVRRVLLEQWKAEDEGFALALEEARANYEWDLLRRIKEARKGPGAPDWRALAWLGKNTSAEGLKKLVRTGQSPHAAAEKCANLPESSGAPATDRDAASESTANLPETPIAPPAMGKDNAILPKTPARAIAHSEPLAGRITPTSKTASFPPETRQPHHQRAA